MFSLTADEHIELETRKHWFIIAAEEFGYVFLLIFPFVVYPFVSGTEFALATRTVEVSLSPALATFLGSGWVLLAWMRMVGTWTDYYLDTWTVTDKRIVDIEQRGLFHRQTSIFRIERIQDVTVEIKGVIATLLDFGDIHVQTAGEGQEFIMRGIANPKRVRHIILQQHDRVTERMEREMPARNNVNGV